MNPREWNLCPNHGKLWDMWLQTGQDGSISDTALGYSWVPSLVWQWLRIGPIEHTVFTSLQPLPWGIGQEEEREGSKGWLMGFAKLFPARGRCGHSVHLQLTKPSCRRSRCKPCHPFGDRNTVQKNIVPIFCLGTQIWAGEVACHCYSLYCFKTVFQLSVWLCHVWPWGCIK